MSTTDQINARRWVQAWKEAGPVLEQMRADEIHSTDTVKAMEILDDAFTSAVWLNPPRESSGLVEQQEIFSRARK